MRDAVTTIGKLTDRQSVVFISSVDEDGFPNTKAMLAPRKREGINLYAGETVQKQSAGMYLFLRQTLLPGSYAYRHDGSAGGR